MLLKKRMSCIGLLFSLSAVNSVPASAPKYYSQVGQDKFIYETFFKPLGDYQGFFLEIGAHDGISHSNTYFFERSLGWRGLCIEPRPTSFKELQRHRKCVCLQVALAAKTEQRLFLDIEGYAAELSGFIDSYAPAHLKRIERELVQHGGQSQIALVPCLNFTELCQQAGLKQIDFISIDTEGSELEILQAIDFSQVSIGVITVENNYADPKIKALMQAQGFVFSKKLDSDEVYYNPQFFRLINNQSR